MKILDCTLRDGGHTNNWNFDLQFAKDLYKVAANTGIDYFEVGYKSSQIVKSQGSFANSFDDFLLNNFPYHPNCKITVMAQYGKFTVDDFIEADNTKTPITTVRVATYPDKIKESFDICKILKAKGYEVFLNIMAISCYEIDEFNKLKSLKNKQILDYLIFSDSFGALLPNKVTEISKKLQSFGFENLGFHSHNNLQMSLANTLSAIEAGCEVVDATICGLGRGAGNLPMELLLTYLYKNNNEYSPFEYITLLETYFPEKIETILLMFGGLLNLHPKYLQQLEKNEDLSLQSIFNKAIELKAKRPIFFNNKLL